MKVALAFVWKALFGIVLCLTPITAILVIGWTSRAMQRAVLKAWYAQANGTKGRPPFAHFAGSAFATRRLAHWPNWFIAEDLGRRLGDSKAAGAGILRRGFVLLVSLFAALWANAKAGLQTLLATWVATLPIMVLWLLSWWGGWENSFNKGYEQVWVGPGIGIAATILFILAMTYVPLAQARQAVAGTWAAFFDYKLVRSLVAAHPLSMLRLVIYFVLGGLVIALLRAAPLAVGNYFEALSEWPAHRLFALKVGYYILCAVAAFALFVWVRLAAARIYARAVLNALRAGKLKADRLSENERAYLASLRLLEPKTKNKGGIVIRAAVSTGRGVLWFGATVPALALWLVFVAELYVAQFLNHDWLAWANQPLVQIPWISVLGLFG